jgi:hypothetical protein
LVIWNASPEQLAKLEMRPLSVNVLRHDGPEIFPAKSPPPVFRPDAGDANERVTRAKRVRMKPAASPATEAKERAMMKEFDNFVANGHGLQPSDDMRYLSRKLNQFRRT